MTDTMEPVTPPNQPMTVKSKNALVQNLLDGPVVWSTEEFRGLEWAAVNDTDGNDFQYVSRDVIDTPSFIRALNRGVFAIVEADAETLAVVDEQNESYARRMKASKQNIEPEAPLNSRVLMERGKITMVDVVTGVDTSKESRAVQIVKSTPVTIDALQR